MKKLIKFAVVGASGTIIGLAALWIMTEKMEWYYLLAYAFAFVLSASHNYSWNSLWTFKDKQANAKGFSKYLTVSTITLGINLTLMFVLTDIIGLWYMFSAVTVTIIIFLINFLMSRRYVWNVDIVK